MNLRTGVFLDRSTVDNGDLRLDALDRILPEWRLHDLTAPEDTAARLRGANIVITNKVRIGAAELDAAPGLKLVAIAATGADNVDLEAARERGVVVCNVRDYCSDSLAQHVLAMVLNLVTHQAFYVNRARSGEWTESGRFSLHDQPIRELSQLSLGVIGYGNLGRAVAARARALGMNILVGERRGKSPRPSRLAFMDVIRSADVLTLHCPLTPDTRHMIDATVLGAMKKRAILINTARGGIVDEMALANALRNGDIAGAGVDVLSQEPPPPDHPLLADDIPNLLLTPHNAWASITARQALVDQLVKVIRAFERGTPMNRLA
ncbi:D-2-hydroxyacid dehydrogenase [Marinihelvus fidelis]|uniref:D-2-hydroxyacid dehydrogenase n=1 Tax=Marinihelvus fidelis TaxID=2613842 RepID=A0A5N0T4T2_9GAMM|nr:D-2-hydroxyacid dehydrogenase [Marinihelvus fidelis]KAA9129798.1 D-2-hydroxyacid dehydrogenase [Marinihelvus fidelis]